jgi:hypothetical protein
MILIAVIKIKQKIARIFEQDGNIDHGEMTQLVKAMLTTALNTVF